MPTCRSRRVVRLALLAGGVIVLLPVWYVLAWLTVSRAAGSGLIGSGTANLIRPAFVPLIRYCDQPRPGVRILSELWWRTNPLHVLHKAPGTFDQSDTGIVHKPTNAHVFCPNDLMEVQNETAIPTDEVFLPPRIDPWQSPSATRAQSVAE